VQARHAHRWVCDRVCGLALDNLLAQQIVVARFKRSLKQCQHERDASVSMNATHLVVYALVKQYAKGPPVDF
jgi:hypothetical protein